MVQLIHNVQKEHVPFREVDVPGAPHAKALRSAPDVTIAVAAFPTGHPHSRSFDQDLDTLLAKEAAGANLAITQLFFHADDYLGFVDRARAAGVGMRILPGLMPVLSVRQLRRAAELTGEKIPADLLTTLEAAPDADAQRRIGIRFATRLAANVLAGGATGLHLYTFNRHHAVLTVLRSCGLLPTGNHTERAVTDAAASQTPPPVASASVGVTH